MLIALLKKANEELHFLIDEFIELPGSPGLPTTAKFLKNRTK